MKSALLGLLPLILFPAGRTAPAPADAPRFAVEEGTVLRKVFEQTLELDLDSMSMSVDGQEFPTDSLDLSMARKSNERVELVDTYHKVGDGRPLELERAFDTLESKSVTDTTSTQGGEDSSDHQKDDRESDLEGRRVKFTWDADEKKYTAAYVGEGGDEDLLEDLDEDTDLRAFLPEGEVAEGDTWTVDGKALGALYSPGGDVAWHGEDAEEDEGDGLDDQFEKNLQGEVKAVWGGTREVEGRKLGVIRLSGEISSEAEQDVDDGPGEGTSTAKLGYDFEGELLWDLAAGHFASIELSGAMTLGMQSDMTMGEHKMAQSMEFTGTLAFKGSAARE
jgi:hypothetical protein